MATAKKPLKNPKVMSVTLLPGDKKENKLTNFTVNRNSATGISQKLFQGGEYYVAKRAPKPKPPKPAPPKTERTMRAKAAAKKARLGRDGKTK